METVYCLAKLAALVCFCRLCYFVSMYAHAKAKLADVVRSKMEAR